MSDKPVYCFPFPVLVEIELAQARKLHPPIHSLHEGYAVLLEEVDELWEQVRMKSLARDPDMIGRELIQIAAMAQRMAEDLGYCPLPLDLPHESDLHAAIENATNVNRSY